MCHTFTLSKCFTTLITGLTRNKLPSKSDSRRKTDAKVFYKRLTPKALSLTPRKLNANRRNNLEEPRGELRKVMTTKIQRKNLYLQSRRSLKLLSLKKAKSPVRQLLKLWRPRKLATRNN